MRAWMHRGLVGLFSGVLVVGCSLSGLVFDRDGSTSSTVSSSASGSGGGSDPVGAGAGGGDGGVMVSMCMTDESGQGGGEINCIDTKDNDDNNAADCEDPHCAALGYRCFSLPNGWEELVAFHVGAPSASPCCTKDFPSFAFEGGDTPSGEPATCNACTCAPSVVSCSVTVEGSTQSTCGTTSAIKQTVGQCQAVTGLTNFKMAAPSASAAACQPGGGTTQSRPGVTWSNHQWACSADRISKMCGLGPGHLCARSTVTEPVCIWKSGEVACPSDFPDQHTFLTGVNDTRVCDPATCKCGSTTGTASCSASVALFGTTDCNPVGDGGSAELGSISAPASCAPAPNTSQPVQSILTTVTPGPSPTCTPNTPSTKGTVEPIPTSVRTVCCSKPTTP